MIDLSMIFSEDELWGMIQKWQKEADDLEKSHNLFKEFMRRLEEARLPFRQREQDLLVEKGRSVETPTLTVKELEDIWRGFPKIRRKIEEEIYG